jgi:ABC-type multidrug transport system ATPase subunit
MPARDNPGAVYIGSASGEVDLVIDDASVSPLHCIVLRSGQGEILLVALAGSTGTWIDDGLVEPGSPPRPLAQAKRLRLGNVVVECSALLVRKLVEPAAFKGPVPLPFERWVPPPKVAPARHDRTRVIADPFHEQLLEIDGRSGRFRSRMLASVLIGTSPECELRVGGQGIAPVHAVLSLISSGRVVAMAAAEGLPMQVDGRPTRLAEVKNGTRLTVGSATIPVGKELLGRLSAKLRDIASRARVPRLDPVLNGRIVVGSSPDCDVVLPYAGIEPRHVQIDARPQTNSLLVTSLAGSGDGRSVRVATLTPADTLMLADNPLHLSVLPMLIRLRDMPAPSSGIETVVAIPWELDEIVIGRGEISEGVNFTLGDGSVSVRHLKVLKEGTGFVITPLDARNPTRVDGRAVTAATRVTSRERISLGRCEIRLVALERPPEPELPPPPPPREYRGDVLVELDGLAVASPDALLRVRTVVDNLSMCLYPGEFVVVQAAAASLDGLADALHRRGKQTGGSIRLNGAALPPSPAECRRWIGVARQQDLGLAALTIEDDLVVAARSRGGTSGGREAELVAHLASQCGISSLLRHRAGDHPEAIFGVGPWRRALVARALAHQPSVLLVVDLFDGLPAREQSELADVLRSVAADGVTVIAGTQELTRAVAERADLVALLANGRLGYLGPFDAEMMQHLHPEEPEEGLRKLMARERVALPPPFDGASLAGAAPPELVSEMVERFEESPAFAAHVAARQEPSPHVVATGIRNRRGSAPGSADWLSVLIKAQFSQWLSRPLAVAGATVLLAGGWGLLLALGAMGDDGSVTRANRAVLALRLGCLLPLLAASLFAWAQVWRDRRWLHAEHAYGLSATPYLLAGMFVRLVPLGVMGCVGGVLSLLFAKATLGPGTVLAGGVYVHWTLGYIGVCLGLAAGFAARTARAQALVLAASLVVASVLGGIPTPVPQMSVAVVREFLSGLSPVRWGVESMVLLNATSERLPKVPTDNLREIEAACGRVEPPTPFTCDVDGSGAVVALAPGCTSASAPNCRVDLTSGERPCRQFCERVAQGAPGSPVDDVVGIAADDPYRVALMKKNPRPKIPAGARGSVAMALGALTAWGLLATVLVFVAAALGLGQRPIVAPRPPS